MDLAIQFTLSSPSIANPSVLNVPIACNAAPSGSTTTTARGFSLDLSSTVLDLPEHQKHQLPSAATAPPTTTSSHASAGNCTTDSSSSSSSSSSAMEVDDGQQQLPVNPAVEALRSLADTVGRAQSQLNDLINQHMDAFKANDGKPAAAAATATAATTVTATDSAPAQATPTKRRAEDDSSTAREDENVSSDEESDKLANAAKHGSNKRSRLDQQGDEKVSSAT
ncbi:hypothetical protein CAOG_08271 [Capsaspora owczarzaki ATCC 30864]|uniref:Uncharacterized protein n=1 Tax=Capsaspora owczarzaki (strain ATCC 30864) TaxID=595528 RepID=A0A0D2WYV7_CAPO3|nr:hypothetical protein CAOG_08271 [Capsaspora owczarzaki ATCC 30864]KJE98283.1 hypothetical protein CAOG_008271 [Capsaspora owczarzaki ATCC 30864]|eukprot:XP_004342440.1 hypothetical protein CAOG_08271 [Capsaspora owczarzaki ATCC 30864]